jgi:hypothetical protein
MTMTDAEISTNLGRRSRRATRMLVGKCLMCVVALLWTGVGGPLVRSSCAADPAPQASGSASVAVPRLPMIDAQGPPSHVQGKIVRTSRGRKGPVRLLVERKAGDQVTVLVGPDDFCDRVGLSLQSGETVDVEGALVKGERPILIAAAFKTPDGKTVRIRDASGQLIESGGPAGTSSGGPTGAGEPAKKATVSGPAAPSAQK